MKASPPRRRVRVPAAVLVLCATILCVAGVARAADYVIGAEDVLAVSVWLHPELERTVPVGSDGTIVFAPVGDIAAAGLTTRQLADRIAERLSTYLRQTATVTVTVSQYLSRSVYVSGAVAKPGRYGFENLPNLVDALSAAGGALPGSDLSQIQLVRKDGANRKTQVVDVSAVLRTGDTSSLPALQAGDAIVIPPLVVAGTTGVADAVGVLGQVNKPGIYPVGPGADIWLVLAAAGGVAPGADMSSVRVLTRGPDGVTVVSVNLKEHLARGTKSPVTVRPGDVVYLGERGGAAMGRTVAGLYQILLIGRDALNTAVLADYLKNRNNNVVKP
jgi:polysaccharide export outer membrane protein